MQYTKLTGIDLPVSRVAFGCMSTVANPTYQGVADEQAIAAIHRAIDLGITLFDTAPGYGNGASEALLGRALVGKRDHVIIADKVNTDTLSPDDVQRECEKSLRLLQTDVIDLYQIHWPKNVLPISETLGAMLDLVKQGKVRAMGVCNFGPSDMADALDFTDTLVTNQVAYSMLARAAEFELQPRCVEAGVGLLCYSPLAQGLLSGRYRSADEVPPERARTRMFSRTRPQSRHDEAGCEAEGFAAIAAVRRVAERLGQPMSDVALAWLLHQPAVTSVLVGASRPDQVERNVQAADLQLSAADLRELDAATAPVKQALGPNLDMWATASRIR